MLFTPNLELRGAGPSELGAGGLSFHQILEDTLKFGLSEKHTKFENIFLMVWTFTIVILQSMRKIAQISVCFSESLNFNWMVPMPVVLLICHRKSDILRRLLSNVKL